MAAGSVHSPRSHVAHRADAGSASSDDSSKLRRSERRLEKEIAKIENEIKLLSAQRSRMVRSAITMRQVNVLAETTVHPYTRRSRRIMERESRESWENPNLSTRMNTTAANVGLQSVPGKLKPDAKVNVEAVRMPGSPAALNSVVVGDCAQGISGNDSQRRNVAEPRTILRKQLKLEKYDGLSVPLETFVAKYKNCAKF